MVVSRTDADAIRDAIQALIFFAKSPPRTRAQHSEVSSAWQTIERLQPGSIEIPGRDSKEWVFQLRAAAWKVYSWIFHQSGALSSRDLQHLKDCQDTLRIIFTSDDARAAGESMPSQDETRHSEEDSKGGRVGEPTTGQDPEAGIKPLRARPKSAGGRPPVPEDEARKRKDLVVRWHRAKDKGVRQEDFCSDNKVQLKYLTKCLNWLEQRRRRNDKQ